ncbi:Antirestriction protein KlcA [Ralstonia thomasii]|uniref:antirestriction protein n=1 Tax=Ralstonia TaxID=48736 RepID=UPI000BC46AD9|nr:MULTISPECIES: antirestriction protein [Ralstonia]MBT2180966.1 antirestriction protein [Ralstonia pickettii]POH90092.1 antirestriction protein [Ralstonia pickettii]CAJ0718642.1 Antirestriction protein KlcA [Ralstonia sp. LMG 18095]
MNDVVLASPRLTSYRVEGRDRTSFAYEFFGSTLLIHGVASVFGFMRKLAPTAPAVYGWTFHRVTNGAYYMAPVLPGAVRLQVEGNGFDGFMSADAAGIAVTLFALGALAWDTSDTRIVDLYHLLRDFACAHAEASEILAAID